MLTALIAFQHADSAFPSGSFAFSNGMEGLSALPMPLDRNALKAFVEATLKHRWAGTDRPALILAYRAGGDIARLADIDDAVEAATLAAPFRLGSRRAGRALLTSHHRLGTPGADTLMSTLKANGILGHLATMQGFLWRALGVGETEAVAMAGYQIVAGLLSAAVRLGQIGAIEAQKVVCDVLPVLDQLLLKPVPADASLDFESFAPLADIAAMRGAGTGAKLFSN